jgi:hypothetical protein
MISTLIDCINSIGKQITNKQYMYILFVMDLDRDKARDKDKYQWGHY